MKVLVRLLRKFTKSGELSKPHIVGKLFAEGVRNCGDDVKLRRMTDIRNKIDELMDYDVVVIWGFRHVKKLMSFREAGKDILTLELGYVGNREEWISLGFNGLNGQAEHMVGTEPRWQQLWGKDILKPWSMKYDHVLLIGQIKRDISTGNNSDLYEWYQYIIDHYHRKGVPVTFRRHPREVRPFRLKNITIDESNTLEEAMVDALVVTYSSNVGVDAVLAGRPTTAASPVSMVYGWAGKGPNEVESFDRKPWLHRMAYCQWHLDELKDGTAWSYYRTRYIKK